VRGRLAPNVPTDTASSTSIKRNNRLERTGLFREFVELQPSEPQILGFANKFGVLTDGQDLSVGRWCMERRCSSGKTRFEP